MNVDRVKKIYVDLWTLAERRGANGKPKVHVHYSGMIQGEGGRFQLPEGRHAGRIEIDRPFYDNDHRYEPHWHRTDGGDVDLVRELCILAHEHGHAVSYEREHAIDYYAAVGRFREANGAGQLVAAADFAAVLEEEKRAWDFGREALAALQWQAWDLFDVVRASTLKTYEAVPHKQR